MMRFSKRGSTQAASQYGKSHKWRTHKGESTEAEHRDGATCSSVESCESRRSEGVALSSFIVRSTHGGRTGE